MTDTFGLSSTLSFSEPNKRQMPGKPGYLDFEITSSSTGACKNSGYHRAKSG